MSWKRGRKTTYGGWLKKIPKKCGRVLISISEKFFNFNFARGNLTWSMKIWPYTAVIINILIWFIFSWKLSWFIKIRTQNENKQKKLHSTITSELVKNEVRFPSWEHCSLRLPLIHLHWRPWPKNWLALCFGLFPPNFIVGLACLVSAWVRQDPGRGVIGQSICGEKTTP